jgi:5-(carboxyamino)imidazole ribonucleotide synthase
VHLYGKGERAGRKLGHVNIVGTRGEDVTSVRERAMRAAHWLSHAEWTDGWDEHS